MKKTGIVLLTLALTAGLTVVYAADAEKGKELFASPTLGGGTSGKSCLTCHAEGKGLGSDLFDRKEYTIMGMKKASLEEVINVCIETPLEGKAIDPKGGEMQDLMAYIKTLLSKPAKVKKTKQVEGC